MEKKNSMKNIFYIFFAFCFLTAGIMTMNISKDNLAKAEDISSEVLTNETAPPYFSVEELYVDNGVETVNESAIDDTFLYFVEGTTSSKYKLSFLLNSNETTNDIYKYVYYPDPENKTVFQYYNISQVTMTINGETVSIPWGNCIDDYRSGMFAGSQNLEPHSFEMIFSGDPTSDNNICILDESGEVIEGIYNISITYTLFTCTDGRDGIAGEELKEEAFTEQNPTLNYSFYVLDKSNYITNNKPNITNQNFDNVVSITNTNPNYAYYLYSNYSAKGNQNKIPYIEFDYTRFEATISKVLSDVTTSATISYDKDTKQPVLKGDDIVKFICKDNKCYVYFTDVGDYDITFNTIKILDYVNQEVGTSESKKYALEGLSAQTKKVKVYMYGYQLNYTDFDKPLDSNNMRAISELKHPNIENGIFDSGADITSKFLNSNESYTQTNWNSTFLIKNVADYITNNDVPPVKTNQPPLKFTSNAKINGDRSYIYSTNKISSAYTEFAGVTLNGETLYRTKFNGKTESTTGTYIYFISYTFDNYYENENSRGDKIVFHQVFYFEIYEEVPSISIHTIEGKNVPSGTFTNQTVTINTNSTTESEFSKDVTVRLYKKSDYKNYDSEYGIDYVEGENLSENGYYTVRLYFTNEISSDPTKLSINSSYYIREQSFTIDKTQIANVKARNVSEILNSTNYNVVSDLTSFVTNQSIVLSWDEKASEAKTYANFRYFGLDKAQYYSTTSQENTSDILSEMLGISAVDSYIPVNAVLDLTTTNNIWQKYYGNSKPYVETVSTEYVLNEAGLYLVDIYDDAGNHTVECYMIDNTSPLFVVEDSDGFELTSPSMYITEESTLHWAKNKAIYVANFNSISFDTIADINNITQSDIEAFDIYKLKNNTTSVDLFKKIYQTVYQNNYIKAILSLRTNPSASEGIDEKITSYNGYYITIPIAEKSYYLIRGEGNNAQYYQSQTVHSYDLDIDKEMTYSVLIRDLSNTKKDFSSADDALVQYTNYSSASQTIRVSHDSSQFVIQYTPTGSSSAMDLIANSYEVTDLAETPHKSQTAYVSPTNLKKTFSLSFTPTVEDGEQKIQVDTVTIKYYPYQEKTVVSNGVSYSFYEFSDSYTEDTIYKFDDTNASKTPLTFEIRPDSNNYTREGKYEITRTYCVDSEYSYAENDYLERTYVLYVDRNEVISPSTPVTDGTNTHLESLVGGDVFVAVFDNQIRSDLVVTYPNSDKGNTDGASLYNNSEQARPVFTTNMLPVNIYVPQYKYTSYVNKVESLGSYYFEVKYDFFYTTAESTMLYQDQALATPSEITLEKNTVIDVTNESTGKILYNGGTYYIDLGSFKKNTNQNYYNDSNEIVEYLLYAELYKDGTAPQNLIAKTSSNYNNPTSTSITSTHGFLDFYTSNGQKLVDIDDAGRYYVKLYQGRFGLEKGSNNANNFEQSLTFSFEVKSSKPDFEAQTLSGTPLNADGNVYYTNQSNALLFWEAGSNFIADIDIDLISFKTSTNPTVTYLYKDNKNFFKDAPYIANDLYVAEIDLKEIGVYTNGAWVDITMQFKNHNDTYYQKVTKRICVDLSAPSDNIQNLVANSISANLFTNMDSTVLRKYYTAENAIATDLATTSYNVSYDTGDFAYYSYIVTQNYLDTLKNKTYATYVRQFEDGVKYNNNFEQETAYSAFVSSNYTEISNYSGFEVGKYYEVVESDMAGNLTIYTIFVTSYQEPTDSLITLRNSEGSVIEYKTEDYLRTLSYPNATHNIYAPTDYAINNINYFGDQWVQFKLTTYSANGFYETKAYALTPWDTENAYNLTDGTEVEIGKLINSAVSTRFKNSISFYDRTTKQYVTFYINNRNVTLKATLTNEAASEYIEFNMPSDQAIQDKQYSSNYITYLKISAFGVESPLYEYTNKLGYASLWTQKNEDIIVFVDSANELLTFTLNPDMGFERNTRITYEYIDNYGRPYKEIHLYNEPIITAEVQSQNDLYAYYDTTGKLFYITRDGFKYLYNIEKYDINIYECDTTTGTASIYEVATVGDTSILTPSDKATKTVTASQGITTITVLTTKLANYNDTFVVIVKDKETKIEVKRIFFKLHNELPEMNVTTDPNTVGQFKLMDANGNNITEKIINPADPENLGYFSEVRLIYTTSDTFYPVKYSYSTDKNNWIEITSGTRFKCQSSTMEKYYLKIWYDETYLSNELNYPAYIYGYVPEEQIYEFNLSSLTATYWVEQTVDKVTTIIEKSDKIFENNGQQYSNYYIVNCNYALAEESVSIKTNEELGIRYFKKGKPIEYISPDNVVVTTQIYTITNTKDENGNTIVLGNIPAFETTIAITYIPESDNFVKDFFTYNMNGIIDKTENLVNTTSKVVVVSEDYATLDNVQLQWTKYYGYPQNTIGIKLVKDGIELDPIIYSKKDGTAEYNYLYLTHSGKYTISFIDSAGNVQKFNRGMVGQTDKFTFIFLKDVPFTVTSTDILTGEQITTEPIKQAVYNSAVTLNIDPSTRSEFYSTQGYPKISVLRNGVEYKDYTGTNVEYVFEETGYYQIMFTATSNQPGVNTIRQETYEFTILDPDEYRYTYIFNGYSNYYIESVYKNGVEISKNLIDSLEVPTININEKAYLKQLPLSYLDEKTGAGTYVITVNSNDRFYKGSAIRTTWTYQVKIQVGSAPIKISLAEGDSTTGKIDISFNQANIYSEMGNCKVRVVYYNSQNEAYIFNSMLYEINSESTGEVSASINNTGTYYIQIVSNSNNLLYSYKVVRAEPMNVATIIAIVISVIVVVVVIFIIIKLRKRISVK